MKLVLVYLIWRICLFGLALLVISSKWVLAYHLTLFITQKLRKTL